MSEEKELNLTEGEAKVAKQQMEEAESGKEEPQHKQADQRKLDEQKAHSA